MSSALSGTNLYVLIGAGTGLALVLFSQVARHIREKS